MMFSDQHLRNSIQERIVAERTKHGLSQSELGKKINRTTSGVSSYETGDRVPPIGVLYQLADIFDCSLDYLVGRSTDRNMHCSNNQSECGFEKFSSLVIKLENFGFNVSKLMEDE